MSEANSRRLFLQKCFSSALRLAFVPIIIESCTSETKEPEKGKNTTTPSDPCSDSTDISKDDIKKRESLSYVLKAPSEDKHCGNCNLWLPPVAGSNACGRCLLFKGPVPDGAYCTYWAPKV